MGYVREIQYVMRLKNKDHHQQKKYLDAQIKKKKNVASIVMKVKTVVTITSYLTIVLTPPLVDVVVLILPCILWQREKR